MEELALMERHLSIMEVKTQVALIQQLMRDVMIDGQHFGVIPGTEKPTLLKPGAEKICFTFRLIPEFQVERIDLPGDHREYQVITTLRFKDGSLAGQGVGTCTSMESRYRYRWDDTGNPVPHEYWDHRDRGLIGGESFAPRKAWVEEDGKRKQVWRIFQKIEHSDPADYYNTILKMAKKRSLVDATITSTAASDIFTQDVEDLVENGVAPQSERKAPEPPKRKPKDTPPPQDSNPKGINPQQSKAIQELCKKAGLTVGGREEGTSLSSFIAQAGIVEGKDLIDLDFIQAGEVIAALQKYITSMGDGVAQ